MTAEDKKNNTDSKEMEEKKVEEKEVNDDREVVLDTRGLYKIGDKWFVKIKRINVAQMIAAWGVISQAFLNVQGLNLDFTKAGTWGMLFLTALPYAQGRFYMFLERVLELQNTSDLPDEKFFNKENVGEYSNYIRRDLKTEELVDIINVIYDQEKDRFTDLLKKVRPILEPLILVWKEDQKKRQKEAVENLKNIGKKDLT